MHAGGTLHCTWCHTVPHGAKRCFFCTKQTCRLQIFVTYKIRSFSLSRLRLEPIDVATFLARDLCHTHPPVVGLVCECSVSRGNLRRIHSMYTMHATDREGARMQNCPKCCFHGEQTCRFRILFTYKPFSRSPRAQDQ